MSTYVDDCYAIIHANPNNIWAKIEQYINKMNRYFNNNRLQMNTKKTNVMIIKNNNDVIEEQIIINNNTIRNLSKLTVLGIVFNNKLDWNSHLQEGKGLIFQLKQRLNSIKLISKYISQNFAKQLANGILISKINYNLEVWGCTNKTNLNKINKIILDSAKTVLGTSAIGQTNEWVLKQLNWMNITAKYEHSAQNTVYKFLNSNNNHIF